MFQDDDPNEIAKIAGMSRSLWHTHTVHAVVEVAGIYGDRNKGYLELLVITKEKLEWLDVISWCDDYARQANSNAWVTARRPYGDTSEIWIRMTNPVYRRKFTVLEYGNLEVKGIP